MYKISAAVNFVIILTQFQFMQCMESNTLTLVSQGANIATRGIAVGIGAICAARFATNLDQLICNDIVIEQDLTDQSSVHICNAKGVPVRRLVFTPETANGVIFEWSSFLKIHYGFLNGGDQLSVGVCNDPTARDTANCFKIVPYNKRLPLFYYLSMGQKLKQGGIIGSYFIASLVASHFGLNNLNIDSFLISFCVAVC